MSNRMFTLTLNAIEVLDKVPKRSRSKFVSDAIINYAKKKDVFSDYLVKVEQKNLLQIKSTKSKGEQITSDIENENKAIKKKVKIDDGY